MAYERVCERESVRVLECIPACPWPMIEEIDRPIAHARQGRGPCPREVLWIIDSRLTRAHFGASPARTKRHHTVQERPT